MIFPEHLPLGDIEAFLDATYGTLTWITPDGTVIPVPSEHAKTAAEHGFKGSTPNEITMNALKAGWVRVSDFYDGPFSVSAYDISAGKTLDIIESAATEAVKSRGAIELDVFYPVSVTFDVTKDDFEKNGSLKEAVISVYEMKKQSALARIPKAPTAETIERELAVIRKHWVDSIVPVLEGKGERPGLFSPGKVSTLFEVLEEITGIARGVSKMTADVEAYKIPISTVTRVALGETREVLINQFIEATAFTKFPKNERMRRYTEFKELIAYEPARIHESFYRAIVAKMSNYEIKPELPYVEILPRMGESFDPYEPFKSEIAKFGQSIERSFVRFWRDSFEYMHLRWNFRAVIGRHRLETPADIIPHQLPAHPSPLEMEQPSYRYDPKRPPEPPKPSKPPPRKPGGPRKLSALGEEANFMDLPEISALLKEASKAALRVPRAASGIMEVMALTGSQYADPDIPQETKMETIASLTSYFSSFGRNELVLPLAIAGAVGILAYFFLKRG